MAENIINQNPLHKDIVIHIGPHKTGTTSIQAALSQARELLAERGIAYLHDNATREIGKCLCDRKYEEAAQLLCTFSTAVSDLPEERILLSHEDFSGHFPGRSSSKQVYPTLTRNLQTIAENLSPHRVRFVFYERDQDEWLYSCYRQLVRYRKKYSSFENYQLDMKLSPWSSVVSGAEKKFRADFIIFPYRRDPAAGLGDLLALFDLKPDDLHLESSDILKKNISLEPDELFVYERINARAFIPGLIPVYKQRASAYMRGDRPFPLCDNPSVSPVWPRELAGDMFTGMEGLTARAHLRVGIPEDQPDLLPPPDADLRRFALENLPADFELPDISRKPMRDQHRILEYHLRGSSRLAFINALTISYLRRDTRHTEKARKLFHRIWEETGLYLVTEISTRWLLSTLQTFLDHPANHAQQVIGASGYFYGNMMKIYEGERALEGREPDEVCSNTEPATKGGFRGLDRYPVGGTDLLLNTNAMLLEIASLDPTAGLVLEELLLRTSRSKTVFSRADMARIHHGIDIPPFSDVWSFFEKPQI